MGITLEQEFEMAKIRTMKKVVNAVTMKVWIDSQLSGVQIPTFLIDHEELQHRASNVADKVLAKIMDNGELESAFEESWQAIAEFMP